jgi:hypothetical protein
MVLAPALTALGQQGGDPNAVLLQTRERLLDDLARMPRYTCVQTITRNYYRASIGRQGQACAAMIAAPEPRKPEQLMYSWDRLRLEVAIVDNTNVYSWVGAPRFEEDAFGKVAGRGPLGSGDFGTFLLGIFGQAIFRFQSEENVDGRQLLAYSYEMPLDRSRYNILTEQGWRVTAFSGEIVLDPEAADIAQLTVRTAELPKNSDACQATSEVDYGRTKIHDRMILIPRETRLRMLRHDGTETLNVTSYENCREYSSKSRVLPEAPPSGPGAAVTPEAQPPPSSIPAGLHFTCRIVTAIDSDTAAAGDPIEAVLRSPLRDKQKEVLAPAGARIRGRLVHFERRLEPVERFQIGVQWESVEIAGQDVPLTAVRDQSKTQPKTQVWAGTRLLSRLPPQDASDAPADSAGYFLFPERHLRLKQLDSEWITTSPAGTGKAK